MQYLRDNAGVLESSSNGSIWVPVLVGNPFHLGTLQLRDNAGALEVSDDAGSTWTPVGAGTPAEIDNPVTLGTLQLRDNAGALEVSDDAGSTWKEIRAGAIPVHVVISSHIVTEEEAHGDLFVITSSSLTLTIPDTLPDGSHIKLFSYAGDTTIDPGTNGIIQRYDITAGSQTGTPGQALLCDNSAMGGGHTLELILFTDTSGILYAENSKIWLVLNEQGVYTFET